MDRIITKQIALEGGLITNLDLLQQGVEAPGSALRMVNFEPSVSGGYSRVAGYTKYSQTAVPGTGPILGVCVLGTGVLACRGDSVYIGSGSSWTKVSTGDVRANAGYYRFTRYNFAGTERIALVNGVNRPAAINSGGAGYTVLTGAPLGAAHVSEFRGRLWFGKGNLLTASQPLEEAGYDGQQGAVELNAGDTITGLKQFRDRLIIFCQNRILRLTGQSRQDFRIDPITDDLGCLHPDTIVEFAGDVIFLAPDGLRTLSGTEKINDVNLDSISRRIQPTLQSFSRTYSRMLSVVLRSKTQFRLMAAEPGTIFPEVPSGIIGTLKSSTGGQLGWEYGTLNDFWATAADSYYDDLGEEIAAFGNSSGYIYRMEQGATFDGTAIAAVYQSPHLTFEDPSVRKVFRRLTIYIKDGGPYTLGAQLVLDFGSGETPAPPLIALQRALPAASARYGSAVYGVGRYSASLPVPVNKTNLVGTGFAGSFSFSSDTAVPPFTLSAMSIDLSLGGRK